MSGDLTDPETFRPHLLAIARMEEPDRTDDGEQWIGGYELEVVPLGDPDTEPLLLRW